MRINEHPGRCHSGEGGGGADTPTPPEGDETMARLEVISAFKIRETEHSTRFRVLCEARNWPCHMTVGPGIKSAKMFLVETDVREGRDVPEATCGGLPTNEAFAIMLHEALDQYQGGALISAAMDRICS